MLPLLEKIIEVKKPSSGLPKSLLAQYEATAIASGFRVEPLEKGLLMIGKTVTVALKVEFGNRWEFFNTITALRETPADIKVLAISSNSKSISMEAIYTVLKKKLQEKTRWAIIDIEKKKEPMFLNFSLSDLGAKAPARLKEKAGEVQYGSPGKESPSPSMQTPSPKEEKSPTEPEKTQLPPKKEEGPRAKGKSPFSFLFSLPFFGKKKKEPPAPVQEESAKKPVKQRKEAEKERGERKTPLMKKSKNYGMQPADAKPRKKKIYGKKAKK